jgi:beta-lactamase superfamily II metal-dependent hydrolase
MANATRKSRPQLKRKSKLPIERVRKRHTVQSSNRLIPPRGCVVVRMYRIGHGDCFLLAFPAKTNEGPVYVLIDCGYKPGSPKYIKTTAKEVTESIREATGGHIHVAVITHEHQDHVNGITEENFADVTIGETWFAWTEDPHDKYANALRHRFNDRLVTLVAARNQLAAARGAVAKIDDFLAFEFGGDENDFDSGAANKLLSATGGPENSQNKKALMLFRKLAKNQCKYLIPHEKAIAINEVDGLRVFPLGPPRDEVLLHSLNPQGDEGFRAYTAGSTASYFAAAVAAIGSHGERDAPFALRYCVKWNNAFGAWQSNGFWRKHYGTGKSGKKGRPDAEAEENASWRRIDKDWLYSAEQLALDMNNDTNNGSLVLAFELQPGGKVLLFAADAQRGNWISWTRGEWKDGDRTVTIRDLLARTVLYKVGHHGSHNATLKGKTTDKYANLDWMAQGEHAREFAAMITAIRPWAETQKGWDHPLKAIKDALLEKAAGRVFQTDTDVADMKALGRKADWDAFRKRLSGNRLFIDYTISY